MQDRQPSPAMLPPLSNASAGQTPAPLTSERADPSSTLLLRDILSALDRQNELLEELVGQFGAAQRQRNQEIANWRAANPQLAADCRRAAEVLGRVQTAFLETLSDEINSSAEQLLDGDFMLGEFIDRFGPRLAHLSGVLQVLAQLSGPTPQA